jgi:hypothetical protein
MLKQGFASLHDNFFRDLRLAKELIYDKCDLIMSDLRQNEESSAYGACSFKLNGKYVQYRISNQTPLKSGQFVTIWKRNSEGVTLPYDVNDDVDFMIINVRNGENEGQFIFSKKTLVSNGLMSQNEIGGKRGVRVYAPWDITTNKQAIKSQMWQTKYFIPLNNSIQTKEIHNLFSSCF